MISLSKPAGNKLECQLCPHLCKLAEGSTGICGVRRKSGNNILLQTYGQISAYSLDPVEKKPLYHFFPGSNILSIGSYGCNMRCDFCQNHNISQEFKADYSSLTSPEIIVKDALRANKNIGVAFTYNEPVIWFEFMRDIALGVKTAGLKTVMVSNGYVNKAPLNEIIGFIDAFNIDLKAFNNNFYTRLTGADIEPVKKSLKQIVRSGRHLEITTLIIPGMNDDETEMANQAEWIAGELGKSVPLHLSRYFPMFKRGDPSTPPGTLEKLFNIASEKLDHVYLGNLNSSNGQDTHCPGCGIVVTKRNGYNVSLLQLNAEGVCTRCGTTIYRYFTSSTEN
jgi:pyruvate formate lyase activating enzyme